MSKKNNTKNDLRRSSFLLFILIFVVHSAIAQTYSFANRVATEYYEIQPTNEGIYCLFNASAKKSPNTTFRKVFLNQELRALDSTSYMVEGKGKLLASCSNEKNVTHAFYSKANGIEKIVFVVTDLYGKIEATFFKTAADFSPCFNKPLKKLKSFSLSFIPDNGSSEMLIIQPYNLSGSVFTKGRILALNTSDGNKIWMTSEPNLSNVQATNNLLVGLTSATANTYYSTPVYQIALIDKGTGNLVKKIPFVAQGKGYRTVPVFTTNGTELMVAGSEFPSSNDKDGKFYMSMYNLSGERIFDHVDSSAVLSSKRLHMMGNVFDQDGNLVLIGEGWKPDATRAVVSTATSILLAAAVGGYARVYTGIDHKVENVVFATLSPLDGKLKYLRTYPVGPWLSYGRLLTEGSHVLFHVGSQVLIYDVNEPGTAPAPLTSLRLNESLVLTPTGPIVIKRERNRNTLSRLH